MLVFGNQAGKQHSGPRCLVCEPRIARTTAALLGWQCDSLSPLCCMVLQLLVHGSSSFYGSNRPNVDVKYTARGGQSRCCLSASKCHW
ncbi:unnamed protein product [Urochloa humidicola]